MEAFLDDRIINLFSLIAEQVENRQDLFTHEGKIMDNLINSGYHLQEADTALTLMQTLVQKQDDNLFGPERSPTPLILRSMNTEERARFTIDAFSFITKLCRLGIIPEEHREELLEKALTLYTGRIGINQVKSLITMTLFAGPLMDEDDEFSALGRISSTAWN